MPKDMKEEQKELALLYKKLVAELIKVRKVN